MERINDALGSNSRASRSRRLFSAPALGSHNRGAYRVY